MEVHTPVDIETTVQCGECNEEVLHAMGPIAQILHLALSQLDTHWGKNPTHQKKEPIWKHTPVQK